MSDNVLQLLNEVRNIVEHQVELYGAAWEAERNMEKDDSVGSASESTAVGEIEVKATGVESTVVDAAAVDTAAVDAAAVVSKAVPDPDPYARIASRIPEDSPLHAMHTLEEVESWVANTVLIPLDELRINPVFGVGHPDADLMVIGEAPGADEDKQGEPFVGRAGQLLTGILAAIGFMREDVYIANILKSRPPNNRNPEPGEVAAHLPVLYKQIALIRPKVMLCVGKTAGTSLLGLSSSLSAMRNTFHDYHGLPVLVTYHPAALLRNPHWKRPTWEDVQLLRRKYDSIGGRTPSGKVGSRMNAA